MNFERFQQNLAKGKNFIFAETLIGDNFNIIKTFLQLKANFKDIILLESSDKINQRGRYSIIAVAPDAKWIFQNEEIVYRDLKRGSEFRSKAEPIADLKALIARDKIEDFAGLPVMAAGWYGFFGYDMVKYYDNIKVTAAGDIIPDSYFIRPELIIIFDNHEHKLHLSLPIWLPFDLDVQFRQKSALFDQVRSLLAFDNFEESVLFDSNIELDQFDFKAEPEAVQYEEIVKTCQEHIKAGEVFQIVPSRRFTTDFPYSAAAFYRALRLINPSPFLFYFGFDDFVITGSSPEIMVRIEGDNVVIRPLAGTRKRGVDAAEDQRIAMELLADPKEVAEHLMLLDLGRNDVGRVAVGSSVRVTKRMQIEYYSHVMHISSTVEGKLRPELSAIDALLAGFPAGTVTGAPKIRAMQILAEIETIKRSFYSGCIGYFSANAENMDMAITLRTALIKDSKLYIQSGAGVVFDSDPRAERLETEKKAAALMEACRQAQKFVNS
jgi:anthranilate synthase component 1